MSSVLFSTRALLVANLGSVASAGLSNTFSARMLNFERLVWLSTRQLTHAHLLIVPRTDHQKSIFTRENLIRYDWWMGCSMSGGFLSGDQVVGGYVCKACYLIKCKQIWDILQSRRIFTCVSNKLQSIQTPWPVCWRDISAAIMAPWAYNPVAISVAATPTLAGGRSASPVLRCKISWESVYTTMKNTIPTYASTQLHLRWPRHTPPLPWKDLSGHSLKVMYKWNHALLYSTCEGGTCDWRVYQPGINISTVLPSEPHGCQLPRNIIFNENIGLFYEAV